MPPAELMPWHQHWLVDLDYDRIDLVKEGANSQAYISLFKSKGGKTTMDLEAILKAMKPEDADVIRKAMEKKDSETAEAKQLAKLAQDEATEAKGDVAKMKESMPPAPGTSEEEILKSVKDPAVKALLEASIAKSKAAEAKTLSLLNEQNEKEAITKAKELPKVGADEAKIAEVYKKLKIADPALCEDVFGIFKAANALVTDGAVFKERGKGSGNGSGEGSADVNTAWGRIDAAAEVIAKGSNVTKAVAITKAIEANPALYEAYVRAQQQE